MQKCIFLALVLISSFSCEAKVLILTHSYNRPDFISLQSRTFAKFLQDDYEFVVFNDGPTNKIANEIEAECRQQNIRCIRVSQEIHQQPYLPREPWEDINSPSIRTANAIQYSFDNLGFDHEGIVMVIDSDMFLIREFCIEEYLQDNHIAAVAQWRGSMGCIEYLWNGIMFFNMDSMPNKRTLNFNCGTIKGNRTDTGGCTYYYLKENPGLKVRYMRGQLDLTDGDFILNSYELEGREFLSEEEMQNFVQPYPHVKKLIDANPDDVQFFADCAFLHYRRAGNYHAKSNKYHRQKTEILNSFLESLLQ